MWGGYRMGKADGSTPDNYDNYIAFSDVGEPHKLATTSATVSNIQVGDTDDEKITAMAVISTPTDAMGLKGQLVVWTGKRTCVYDGIPPSSNNPQGINFVSAVFRNIGCYSPKSVVQTPHGVVFLGSDGHVYIIRGLAGPERIGTAVWNIFRSMSPRQQRQCAATWTPKDYY